MYEQVKPTIASLKADLKAEYELLKATPYRVTFNKYFCRWRILSLKCQEKEYSIFEIGEEDPSLALHCAIQPIHPITATFRINIVNDKLNSGTKIRLEEEVRAWETYLQSKGIVKFPARTSGVKNAAFPIASLNGKSIIEKGTPQRSVPKRLINQSDRPESL